MLNIGCRYVRIDGFDCYYITELGDVYSYRDRDSKTGWQGLRKMKPHWSSCKNKYLSVTLCNKGKQQEFMIHRLVAQYFCDGYFEGAVVNHKDSNIKNNRFDNLEWITQKENIHKSYISSGIDQTRNFQIYNFYYKNDFIGQFKGRPAVCKYIDEHNLDCSKTGIVRNNKSKGHRLEIG